MSEVCFPRGGKKPTTNKNVSHKITFDIFGNTKTKRGKKNGKTRTKKDKQKFSLNVNVETTSASLLTHNTIETGMLILGRIISVRKMKIEVSLPGRLSGRIMISEISSPYRQLLQSIAENQEPQDYKSLMQIFKSGQYIVCKVTNIKNIDDKLIIYLSVMPEHVNSNLTISNVKEGSLVWGAISSVEEHVYVVDLGIKNCRSFLPKTETNKKYALGEVFWSVVKTKNLSDATVKLSADPEKIKSAKVKEITTVDELVPGMKVNFKVTNHLSNGLEGIIFDEYKAFVNEGLLKKPLDAVNDYILNKSVKAHVLYVMPITKFVFLTLGKLDPILRIELNHGTIKKAQIISLTKGGFYLNLGDYKGYVSLRRLNKRLPVESDQEFKSFVKENYGNGSIHKCRILSYDFFEKIYICTFEKDLIKEEHFSITDFRAGEVVQVEIKEIEESGLLVQAGRMNGYITNDHLTDTTLLSYAHVKSKYKVGQKIPARVWVVRPQKLHFTIKPSFMTDEPVLASYETVKINNYYVGIITKIENYGAIVTFFGNITGLLHRKNMNFEANSDLTKILKIGQVLKCRVLSCIPDKKRILLSLLPPEGQNIEEPVSQLESEDEQDEIDWEEIEEGMLRVGEICDLTVKKISKIGFDVCVTDKNIIGFLPREELTKFPALVNIMFKMYKVGDTFQAKCIKNTDTQTIFSLRQKDIFYINDVSHGMCINCTVKSYEDSLILEPLVKKRVRDILVEKKYICDDDPNGIHLENKQLVVAKILEDEETSKGSTRLSDCWNKQLGPGINLLWNYLQDIRTIWMHYHAKKHALAQLNIGKVVTGTIEELLPDGSVKISLKNGAVGFAQNKHAQTKTPKQVGAKIKCVVLWLDLENKLAQVSLNKRVFDTINKQQTGKISAHLNKIFRAQVLLVMPNFVLCVLRGEKGNGQLAFLPTKVHINDFKSNLQYYTVFQNLRVQIKREESGIIIAVSNHFKRMLKKNPEFVLKKAHAQNGELVFEEPQVKKRKLDNSASKPAEKNREKLQINNDETLQSEDEISIKSEIESDNEEYIRLDSLDIDISMDFKEETSSDDSDNETRMSGANFDDETDQNIKVVMEAAKPVLSGANDFWNISSQEKCDESSGEEEEEVQIENKPKKKKMTPAERAEAARLEEERIRRIETELADSSAIPKTADQFDRLVLAQPNNSMLWINYMAFHLEGTEIEKARVIARKALNTIDFREEQEKLNVWIAFLNLENRYGTKETFSTILREAAQMNDALAVYLQALNILAESNKLTEFNEVLSTATRKFKHEFKMWIAAAEACFKCDQKILARNLMQRALKSLEEKEHVNFIVQMAFMESRFDDHERAEALLEKVLASYPKRVDIWTSYVDMIVKANRIDIARNVLDRAICQPLPAKKIKTLFTKYIEFEKKFGDESSVEKVKQKAAEYVQKALN